MKGWPSVLLIASFVCATPVFGQDQNSGSDFQEGISISIPKGWRVARHMMSPGNIGSVTVYLPATESITSWTQLIVSNVWYKPPASSPKEWVGSSLLHFFNRCAKLEVLSQKDGVLASSNSPYSSVALYCSQIIADPSAKVMQKRQEISWVIAIRGPSRGYVIERDWQGDDASSNTLASSDSVRQEWQNWSDSIRLEEAAH